jgi:hypothetical protein
MQEFVVDRATAWASERAYWFDAEASPNRAGTHLATVDVVALQQSLGQPHRSLVQASARSADEAMASFERPRIAHRLHLPGGVFQSHWPPCDARIRESTCLGTEEEYTP